MLKTKSADLVKLRQLISRRGKSQEEAFLKQLSLPSQDIYKMAVTTMWVPVECEGEIMQAAAHWLLPAEPYALRELGRRLAKENLTSIYKIFIQIPSTRFVIKRTAQMWKTYYDQGQAHVEEISNDHVILIVEDCPELPPTHLETATGFIIGLLELTGLQQIQVKLDAKNPRAWKWDITWKKA